MVKDKSKLTEQDFDSVYIIPIPDCSLSCAHFRAYSVAVMATKKTSFSATIACTASFPAELFCVVCELLYLAALGNELEFSTGCCDKSARHFANKIDCIHHGFWSNISSSYLYSTNPTAMDSFQLKQPDDGTGSSGT